MKKSLLPLLLASLSATHAFAGGHSDAKKPQFMWVRTFEIKSGVSSQDAQKAAKGLLDFVNKEVLKGAGDVTMMIPVGGDIGKFSFFYISDSIDNRLTGRSMLYRLEGFQPHLKAMVDVVESAHDQWYMLPPQGITWSHSNE